MAEESAEHFLRRWVSLGDVLTLAASVVIFSYGYGSLSNQVTSMRADLEELMERQITPGAATQLAAIQQKDASQDQQIMDLRIELRDGRKEMMDAISRVEVKLDAHDR